QSEPPPVAEGTLGPLSRWAPAMVTRLLGVVFAAAMLLYVVRPVVLGVAARLPAAPGGRGALGGMDAAVAQLTHENLALTQQHPERAAQLLRDGPPLGAPGGKPGAALAREDPLGPGRPDGLATSLGDVAPAALAQLLAHEHPQVIAFVIAHLEPRHAAEVLGALPEALGADIIHRIADLQSVSDDMLGEVREILQGQVEGLGRIGKASEL